MCPRAQLVAALLGCPHLGDLGSLPASSSSLSWAALLSWSCLIQQISQPLASLLLTSSHVLSSKLDVRMKDQLTLGGDGKEELSGASQASLQAQSFHLPSPAKSSTRTFSFKPSSSSGAQL